MSSNDPPLSTEGGGVMENIDDPISNPNLDPNVPLIDLTHIKKSLSDKDCSICCCVSGIIAEETFTRGLLQLQAFRCVSCQIRLLIMEAVARLEGVIPDAMDRIGLYHDGCTRFWRNGEEPAWLHNVFMPSEAPQCQTNDIEDITKIPRRNFTWDASREDSMERSIKWAKDHLIDQMCPCAVRADDWVAPTRLIDVDPGGMDGDVQLRESASIPQENLDYAALSYCWGGHKPECMTTPKTIDQNMRCIGWKSMPQTFQDAVTFTRGLGLKYLWIDSICIIQDEVSSDDWRREAGRMFGVYKNAKVTFAALFGENSKTGLRDDKFKQQTRVAAKLRLDQSTYSLCVRRRHYLWLELSDQVYFEGLHKNIRVPLLTRAWTYQERMMSPRKLFFTEDEILYQCACGNKCECGIATKASEQIKRAEIRKTNQVQIQDDDHKIQESWRAVVTNYSGLNLSQPKDRLAALGAMAQTSQRRRRPGSVYLAGLWSDSLHEDLLWYCFWSSREMPSDFGEQSDRPFKLPTWSWASLRYKTCFVRIDDPMPLAEIVTALCVYAEDNRFGTLQQRKLVLRSKTLFCSLRNDGNEYNTKGYLLDVDGATQVTPYWRIHIDSEQECFPDGSHAQDVYLFQILHDRECAVNHCLILRSKDRAANSRTFSRVGIMSYRTPAGSRFDKEKDFGIHRWFEERGAMEECEIE
ncbi:heterokaryon incompatibility protein-domain-containing protein [Phyllosticta capitalensis]|uniref:Heterokaryon incompatibility protein-domain-containing protein n=1 Tax=Phyllosticta capitalensis TaxID=121624 RepID=A0ABR1YNS7_9PEZI